MLVVLSHAADRPAHWVAARLRSRRRQRVELVLVESLGEPGTVWRHTLGGAGRGTEVALADGRVLRTGDVDVVLNRLLEPPVGALGHAVEADADYARSELTAFAASWLRALAPRVVNAPTPQGLCGAWRSPLQWRSLALAAGLPAARLSCDSADPAAALPVYGAEPGMTVLAVGGDALVGEMPGPVRAAARRLAQRTATPLLGLRFATGWGLLDATPYPDLSLAGEAGVDALAAVLAA